MIAVKGSAGEPVAGHDFERQAVVRSPFTAYEHGLVGSRDVPTEHVQSA